MPNMIVKYEYVICDYYEYYLLQRLWVSRGPGILTKCVVAHPTTLSPFSLGFLCNMKKLSQLFRNGSYPCLKGVKCAYSEVVSLLNDVIECILSL